MKEILAALNEAIYHALEHKGYLKYKRSSHPLGTKDWEKADSKVFDMNGIIERLKGERMAVEKLMEDE